MELIVQNREKFGKANSALRREGLIPAELYGNKFKNRHLVVKENDFLKVFKEAGENMVISVMVDGNKEPALIYYIQKDYVSGKVIHVDFYRVDMTERIKTHIPLEFIGEAPAVKEKKGVLNKTILEIEVEALPGDLPHRIDVDMAKLDEVNKSIYAKDLKIPKEVKILIDPETVVATIMVLREEEKVEVPVDVSAVKVEGEEKRKAEQEKVQEKEGEKEVVKKKTDKKE